MNLRLDLFFKNIVASPAKHLGNNRYTITIESQNINFKDIKNLQSQIKYLSDCKLKVKSVKISTQNANFVDSSTVLLFVLSIIYIMSAKPNLKILVHVPQINKSNASAVYFNTLFRYLSSKKLDNNKFLKRFDTAIVDSKYNYFIKVQDCSLDKLNTSRLESEVGIFLRSINETDYDFSEKLMNIVGELQGNASEHSKESTLVFIMKLNDKSIDDKSLYYLNIICFAEDNIYTGISKMFYENINCDDRIIDAHNFHKEHFNNHYTENHFFMLSALQNGITTRGSKSSGGIGLPTSVNNMSDSVTKAYDCYCLCGLCALYFRINYLGLKLIDDIPQIVGLNTSSNYLTDIPHESSIECSKLQINGILYNMILFRDMGENNEMGENYANN